MAALTGDAPLPPAATRLLSLAWWALERASVDANRLPDPLRARVQRGLERVTLLSPRGAALASERLAERPEGTDPSAFGALPGSLAPTPRGDGEERGEISYLPSHDSRPSPSRRRLLEEAAAAGANAGAAAAAAPACVAAAAAPATAAAVPSSPAPRRPSSSARFKALFSPPRGEKAPAATTAAAATAAAPSSPVPKRPSSAQRLKAAFSPKQKQQKSNAIEVSASVVVPPLSPVVARAAPAAEAAAEKPRRPSSAQRLKAAFSPKKSSAGESPASKRPSSAARLRAAFKIGGGDGNGTPSKGAGAGASSAINVIASPARPAYIPGSIAAALGSPSQKRFEF